MPNSSLTRFPLIEKDGCGVFNTVLNKLPIEFTGYNFLGMILLVASSSSFSM